MKSYPRLLESVLQAETSVGKIRLVFGARQTGKSTLSQRIAGEDAQVFNLQERQSASERRVFPVHAGPIQTGFPETALEEFVKVSVFFS